MRNWRASRHASGHNNMNVADVLLNDKSEKLTDELIYDNMIDLMIPMEDSIPVIITLAIKYLSDSPKALHYLLNDDDQEENVEMKRRKEDLGDPLCWDDYLLLPFTRSRLEELFTTFLCKKTNKKALPASDKRGEKRLEEERLGTDYLALPISAAYKWRFLASSFLYRHNGLCGKIRKDICILSLTLMENDEVAQIGAVQAVSRVACFTALES
ncbi:3-epi-6-deoxocathasterone 23-monooxygenase [Tanacetum coccineum]